jgi:hypothetical protein
MRRLAFCCVRQHLAEAVYILLLLTLLVACALYIFTRSQCVVCALRARTDQRFAINITYALFCRSFFLLF